MKKLLLLSLVLASVGLQAASFLHRTQGHDAGKVPDAKMVPKTRVHRYHGPGRSVPQEPRFDYAAAYEELEGEYKYLERRVYRLEAHMNRIADAWMEEKKVAPEPERPVMELRRK